MKSLSGSGPARVGRRTKDLVKSLRPGDVAVIDHEDLDRIAAEGLVEARPAAIVNAKESISGRYPTVGPLLVAAAGIPLLDGVGDDVFDFLSDGQWVRVEGSELWVGEGVVAKGESQTLQTLEVSYEAAKARTGIELERFAENTLDFMRRERHLLIDSPDLPDLRTQFKGRHVLVVVRGHDYRADLEALRGYIGEIKPVLIAVDGGADAILEVGYKPDLIIGDFDSLSDKALSCGAELVVHAYPGGSAPGAEVLTQKGKQFVVFEAAGTSEDVAMIMAFELGAELIVAVGTHASMVEFLEKGRAGMASTFLTRLKVGPILVDAKGVSRLYGTPIRKRDIVFFLSAAVVTFVLIVSFAFPSVFLESIWLIIRDLWRSVFGGVL
ncbi:MAG: hypothetical protein KY395_00850 [Actinobacteria bacterium]|nr:hypothetical protein [Actinomycetota bacterium]